MNAEETLQLLETLTETLAFREYSRGPEPVLSVDAYESTHAAMMARVRVDPFCGLAYFPADGMGEPILSVDALGVVRIGARVIDDSGARYHGGWVREELETAGRIPAPFRAPVRLTDEQRATIAQLCAGHADDEHAPELECRAFLASVLRCDEVTDSNSLWTMVGLEDVAPIDPAEVCRCVELWSAGINPYTGRPIDSEWWTMLERANLHGVDVDLYATEPRWDLRR